MRIEANTLIVDEELGDEAAEEFKAAVEQPEVRSVRIDNGNLAASIVQILWCLEGQKEILVNDPFLARFFEQVRRGE